MMSEFIDSQPILFWIVVLGTIAAATGALWKYWVGPLVRAISQIAQNIRDIADVARALKPHMPTLIDMIERHPTVLLEHDERIAKLEEWRRNAK